MLGRNETGDYLCIIQKRKTTIKEKKGKKRERESGMGKIRVEEL